MPIPNPRAKDVFLDAVELADPGERAAFLDGVCAGDAELRRRVEALLAAHERPESLLDRAAVAPAKGSPLPRQQPATVPVEGPGSRVGPYLLLEPLGEGGMGSVFLAEQSEPVRRRVALKVIKPGMDTAQVVARFEAERQALALMDHPNIAKVLDAGATPAGRPYFVMERVDGVPITGYCDDRRLTPRQRLELFVPVCQAVQHAHQKGIIHRDIKPSNVLVTEVDGRPLPKVIDFGVAKAIEPGLSGQATITHAGTLVGTPEYMSPEQAGASPDVDTRTDVYGLGVLLYELLTGTTPIDRPTRTRATLDEVLRRVREEEPAKPSARLSGTGDRLPSVAAVRATEPARLTRLVRGDLDWIVMRALEKDRARRYETANGLARDLQRYLDGDPVEAGPPSRLYRLRKFARKHRAALAAAAAVALGLLVAVSALALSTVAIARGRAGAIRELARVRAERRELARVYFRHNAMFGKALTSINSQSFDPRSWKKQEFEMVDEVVQFQEIFARQLLSDPEARYEAAYCYYKSGDNEEALAYQDPSEDGKRRRTQHAIESQQRASDLFAQLHAESPGRKDYREALQSSLSHLGLILFVQGRNVEAEVTLRRALSLDDPPTLESAPPGWKELPAGRVYTGRGLVYLAWLVEKGNPREAEALVRRALAHLEEWLRDAPDDKRLHSRVGNEVAWWLVTAPDLKDRLPGRAVALARKATDQAPEAAECWNTLGVALYRTGAWDEAIRALTRSMQLTRGDSPPDWLFLAMAHWRKGDRAEARAWYEKAIAWFDRNRPDDEGLTRFRAEADALIRPGPPDTAMPSGPDAFAH